MSNNNDDILARLKRATEKATETSNKPAGPAADPFSYDTVKEKITGNSTLNKMIFNSFEKIADKFRDSTTLAGRTYDTLGVIWNSYMKPIAWALNPILSAYWKGCKWAFNKVSFDKDGEYSKYRGAAAAVGLSLLTIFNGYATVTQVIPTMVTTSYEAVVIEAFSYQDTLLFSKPDILNVDQNIWGVSACRKYPCEGQVDSIEFRMKDSVYLDLKEFVTKFQPHDPGELKGAFNSEENACNITAYGMRIKLPLVSNTWGTYPHIIKANCITVNGDNWQEAMDIMKAQRSDLQKPEQHQSHLETPAMRINQPQIAFNMP